jgi:hypothetical protein
MSETVKVRVAVAVDDHGSYTSSGWQFGSDAEEDSYHISQTESALGSRIVATYFLTAELPIPKPPAPSDVPATVEVES